MSGNNTASNNDFPAFRGMPHSTLGLYPKALFTKLVNVGVSFGKQQYFDLHARALPYKTPRTATRLRRVKC